MAATASRQYATRSAAGAHARSRRRPQTAAVAGAAGHGRDAVLPVAGAERDPARVHRHDAAARRLLLHAADVHADADRPALPKVLGVTAIFVGASVAGQLAARPGDRADHAARGRAQAARRGAGALGRPERVGDAGNPDRRRLADRAQRRAVRAGQLGRSRRVGIEAGAVAERHQARRRLGGHGQHLARHGVHDAAALRRAAHGQSGARRRVARSTAPAASERSGT